MHDELHELLRDASEEVSELAHTLCIEGWKNETLSVAEEALAVAAYFFWKYDKSQGDDPSYFTYPSVSARARALFIISQVGRTPELIKAVRLRHPNFKPAEEIKLAGLKLPRTHPDWGETVTRSVVLLTRSLAYCQTEIAGQRRLAFQVAFDRSMERRLGTS